MLAVGCEEDEAFKVLRRHSQCANIKLNDLSHRLVTAVGTDLHPSPQTRRAVTYYLEGLR